MYAMAYMVSYPYFDPCDKDLVSLPTHRRMHLFGSDGYGSVAKTRELIKMRISERAFHYLDEC